MSDLVRVRKDGFEYNVGRSYAAAHELELEVLDVPTHDRTGRPIGPTRVNGRPIKPHTTVDQAAAKKAAPRRRAAKKTSTAKTAVTKKAAQSAVKSDTAPSKEN